VITFATTRTAYPQTQREVVDAVRLFGPATGARLAELLGRSKQSVTVSAANAARHGRLARRERDGELEWAIPDRGLQLW
jgi:hypothetical protein